MKNLKITISGNDVVIEGSPVSLEALGSACLSKAKSPENVFIKLTGHGDQSVDINVPGCEMPAWMRPPR